MTLTNCIDKYGKDIPDEISYSILRDVALGLCYLHGWKPNPIIHRDLSANNVLLTSDMTAKISDLGVAKILNLTPAKMTQMTTAPGTAAYMPPEALEKNPDYSTYLDIFSYGVMILHIFSGSWPIAGAAAITDPTNPDRLIPRNEAERREEYFQDMGPGHPLAEHPLTELAKQCLHNHPPKRPAAPDLLRLVEEKQHMIPPTVVNKMQAVRSLQDIQKLRSTIASLEGEIQHLKSQESMQDIQKFQSTIASLEGEIQHLKSQESMQDIQKFQSTIASLEGEIQHLKSQESMQDIQKLQSTIASLEGEIQHLKSQESTEGREGRENDPDVASLSSMPGVLVRGESTTSTTSVDSTLFPDQTTEVVRLCVSYPLPPSCYISSHAKLSCNLYS